MDWETHWRASHTARPRQRTAEEWAQRGASPGWHKSDTGFSDQVLAALAPEPSWTVLDVGCGSGTLALPLAARCTSVTAIDFSPGMIEILRQRCEREGAHNVDARVAGWEDDWERLGLGPHDLALASRSLIVDDLGGALAKLDRAARRVACVIPPVGDGPHDRRVYEAVGRPFRPRADYLTVYGRLHELGIHAHVRIVARTEWTRYASADQAASALAWMLRDPDDAEIERLRSWLRATLVECEGAWRMPAPRVVRWAVIWWTKRGGADAGEPEGGSLR